MRYLNASLVFILISQCAYSQRSVGPTTRSLLIFSDGQEFLQPFIETSLKSFNYASMPPYAVPRKLFSDVNSLNRFVSDNRYQVVLRELLESQISENQSTATRYNDMEAEIRRTIVSKITSYDLFLLVKCNTLGELIEFQFQLFKTIKPAKGETSVPYNISDNLLASEDIFTNPKDHTYKIQIVNSLKRLFPESNMAPQASLKVLGQQVKTGAEIKVPLNTAITLDGTQSGDYESEQLQYVWENVRFGYETKQQQNRINFSDSNDPIKTISIDDIGFYRISFKVYDGVEYSDEVLLTFTTIPKPELKLFDTTYTTASFDSFLSALKHRRKGGSFKAKYILHTPYRSERGDLNVMVLKRKIQHLLVKNVRSFYLDTTAKVAPYKKTVNELQITTEFPFESEKHLYVYTFNNDGFLSEPTKYVISLKRDVR